MVPPTTCQPGRHFPLHDSSVFFPTACLSRSCPAHSGLSPLLSLHCPSLPLLCTLYFSLHFSHSESFVTLLPSEVKIVLPPCHSC